MIWEVPLLRHTVLSSGNRKRDGTQAVTEGLDLHAECLHFEGEAM